MAAEMERLKSAEERKLRDIEFVEHAFYTSNEEAMGVTPSHFDQKNRMPKRPGTKSRSPAKEIPFNEPILQPFAEQVEIEQRKQAMKKVKSTSMSRLSRRKSSPEGNRKIVEH